MACGNGAATSQSRRAPVYKGSFRSFFVYESMHLPQNDRRRKHFDKNKKNPKKPKNGIIDFLFFDETRLRQRRPTRWTHIPPHRYLVWQVWFSPVPPPDRLWFLHPPFPSPAPKRSQLPCHTCLKSAASSKAYPGEYPACGLFTRARQYFTPGAPSPLLFLVLFKV